MPVRPVIRAGNLAATPAGYEHSSARFYICGGHAAYPVMNFLELDDIDLTKLLQIGAESTANAQNPE
jgi:hypothetical protein